MDTQAKVREWTAKMGYTGKIPDSFQNICHASTSPLWEQLIATVKPKAEVEHIRNNILIQRVRNDKKTRSLYELQFPVKELELWKKRSKLEEELKNINEGVAESNRKVDRLAKQNRIKYITIENLTQNIKENDQKTFLLNRKSEDLNKEISEAEEKLTFCKNLTPVEADQSKSEVSETLNRCAKKIEQLIGEQDFNLCNMPDKSQTSESFKYYTDFPSNGTVLKCESMKVDLSSEIYCLDDESLLRDIEAMLHYNDNYLLWNIYVELIEKFKFDLMKCINSENFCNSNQKNEENSKSITMIHKIHIENEFKALKHEQNINKLREILNRQQRDVFEALEKQNVDNVEDCKAIIMLQQQEAGLTAKYDCMVEQLQKLMSTASFNMELTMAQKKSFNIQQQLVEKVREISYKTDLFKKLYSAIMRSKEETYMLVRKLNQFTDDLSWTFPLTENTVAKEIEIFKKFSIENNRQILINGAATCTKDLLKDTVVSGECLDTNTLHMIVALVDSPFSPPETILLNLIYSKLRLSVLKSLLNVPSEVAYKIYDINELRKQDSYVSYAIEKLHSLMRQPKTKQVLSSKSRMNNMVQLWQEMPVKNFVSPQRLFNSNNFEYYQNLFDSYFNKL